MLEYDVDVRPAELLLGTSEQLVEQHELAPFVAVRQLDKKRSVLDNETATRPGV
jgi:hypothetical protein